MQSVTNRSGDVCDLLTGDMPGDMFQLPVRNLIAIAAHGVRQPIQRGVPSRWSVVGGVPILRAIRNISIYQMHVE